MCSQNGGNGDGNNSTECAENEEEGKKQRTNNGSSGNRNNAKAISLTNKFITLTLKIVIWNDRDCIVYALVYGSSVQHGQLKTTGDEHKRTNKKNTHITTTHFLLFKNQMFGIEN